MGCQDWSADVGGGAEINGYGSALCSRHMPGPWKSSEPVAGQRVGSAASPGGAMRSALWRGLLQVSMAMSFPVAGRAQVELRGRFLSETGDPIPGATVTVAEIGFTLRSDSLGRFALSGAAGALLRLQFVAPGYRRDSASVTLGRRPVERDFTLARIDAPEPESNPSTNVLNGRVVDELGQPLSYANVQLNFGRRYVSDDSGRFRLPFNVSGSATLLVRRIGFAPAEVKLNGMPDTALRIQMKAIPVELKGVVVTGASAFRSLDLHGFYQRIRDADRGINHGYFITPEDLARRNPNWITQMADGLPTVRVQRGMIPMKDVIVGSMGCKMTVYLDNIRIVGKLGRSDDFLNEVVMPTHVAAMEIYPRAVMAPPQYQPLNGTCGVVLIWTK